MKKFTTIYGAVFQESEIESLFSKIDVLDSVYEKGSSPNFQLMALEQLHEKDTRFTYEALNYPDFKYCLYILGVDMQRMHDEETFGDFKKSIQKNISSVFKKELTCSFFDFFDADY